MKKLFTILVLAVVVGIGAAKAQATGSTNVHVKLTDVIALTVNDADVNINFNNASDYQNGVSVPKTGHLTVTSNKAYTLKVKAAGNLSGTNGNTDVLSPSVLNIQLPTGGNNTGFGVTPTLVEALTTTDANLLTNANPAIMKLVDVTYGIPSSVSTTNQILGKKADVYTTTVTYTITAN